MTLTTSMPREPVIGLRATNTRGDETEAAAVAPMPVPVPVPEGA